MKPEYFKPAPDSKIEIVSFSLLPDISQQLGKKLTKLISSSNYARQPIHNQRAEITELVRTAFPGALIDQMRDDFDRKVSRVYLPQNLPVLPKVELAKIKFDRDVAVDTKQHLLIGLVSMGIFDLIGFDSGQGEIGAMVRETGKENYIPGLYWHQDNVIGSSLAGVVNHEKARTHFRNIPAVLDELDIKAAGSTRVLNQFGVYESIHGETEIIASRFAKHLEPGKGLDFVGEYAEFAKSEWERVSKKHTYSLPLEEGMAAFWINTGDIYHAGEMGKEKGPRDAAHSRIVVFVAGTPRMAER